MLIVERYQDQIAGVLSCYDRIVIQGNIRAWCFAQGMTAFLHSLHIKIFDYPEFARVFREEVRDNTERIAQEHGLEIEFISKVKEFPKDSRIKQIIKERGEEPGLVHIFSAMETCTSYKPYYDKGSGKSYLKPDAGKCIHYYFYFIDKEFGLCYLRVPTWAPFKLQFYLNGHNWLKTKLDKNAIAYQMRDNAFLDIGDFDKAQALSDKIRVEDMHQALDIFARRYCPFLKKYDLDYNWSISQAEYATDITFKRQSDLKFLYEPLIRTAIHSVKPENIATFLGQKQLHHSFKGEMGNKFNTRILGTRIKHHKGATAIKMYDKFGLILRIETTTTNAAQFRVFREVYSPNGAVVEKRAPMRKGIYSLFQLAGILKACNRRYLEFISTFDDQSQGIKNLHKVSKTVEADDRSYKGFNFFSEDDQKLFEILARGEHNINGFQNKTLRQHLSDKSGGAISRILKRLRAHGLIKKVGKSYKYSALSG